MPIVFDPVEGLPNVILVVVEVWTETDWSRRLLRGGMFAQPRRELTNVPISLASQVLSARAYRIFQAPVLELESRPKA